MNFAPVCWCMYAGTKDPPPRPDEVQVTVVQQGAFDQGKPSEVDLLESLELERGLVRHAKHLGLARGPASRTAAHRVKRDRSCENKGRASDWILKEWHRGLSQYAQ